MLITFAEFFPSSELPTIDEIRDVVQQGARVFLISIREDGGKEFKPVGSRIVRFIPAAKLIYPFYSSILPDFRRMGIGTTFYFGVEKILTDSLPGWNFIIDMARRGGDFPDPTQDHPEFKSKSDFFKKVGYRDIPNLIPFVDFQKPEDPLTYYQLAVKRTDGRNYIERQTFLLFLADWIKTLDRCNALHIEAITKTEDLGRSLPEKIEFSH